MKKICILPFTYDEKALITCCPNGYVVDFLVSPRNIFDQIKRSILYETIKYKNINYCECIESIDGTINTVLIADVDKENRELYEFAFFGLKKAIQMKKDIICFLNLEDKDRYYFEKLSKKNKVSFEYKSINGYYCDETVIANKNYQMFKCPVIYISELVDKMDSYEIFIHLFNKLKKNNKKVIAISNDKYNLFWGQYSINFFECKPFKNIIKIINHKIYNIYLKEKPDIILIKSPEPIMKFNDKITYDFGLSQYILSQAIPGDYLICCSYLGTPYKDFWENINNSIMARYGYSIFCVHLSNKIIDYTLSEIMSTIRVSNERVNEEKELLRCNNGFEFYNLLFKQDFDDFYIKLYEELFNFDYGVI